MDQANRWDELGPYLKLVADNISADQDRQLLNFARRLFSASGEGDQARAEVDMAYRHVAAQYMAKKYDPARPFPNWAGRVVRNFLISKWRRDEARRRNENKARVEIAVLSAERETPETLLLKKEQAERLLKFERMAVEGLQKKYRDPYDMCSELEVLNCEERRALGISRIHKTIASKLNILESLSKVRVLRAKAFIHACVVRYPHVPSPMHYFVTMRYAAFTDERKDHPMKVLESIAVETTERMKFSQGLFNIICEFIRGQLPSKKSVLRRIGPLEVRQVFTEINRRLDKARPGQPIREGADRER